MQVVNLPIKITVWRCLFMVIQGKIRSKFVIKSVYVVNPQHYGMCSIK